MTFRGGHMKNEFNKYGQRLTEGEYQAKCVDLAEKSYGKPGYERAEIGLMIDHRLGKDFPSQKREALVDAVLSARRAIPFLLAKDKLKSAFGKGPKKPTGAALARHLEKKCGKVLDKTDLAQFLGL